MTPKSILYATALCLAAVASCGSGGDDNGGDAALSGTYRTATHDAFAAVVSDGQRDACEATVAAYDLEHGTEFAFGFSPWRPNWDGWTEPVPTPTFWHQRIQGRHAQIDAFPNALAACVGLGEARVYNSIVFGAEELVPQNTTDSVYAAGAYDPLLPMHDSFSAAAAWYLDMGQPLPPRSDLP